MYHMLVAEDEHWIRSGIVEMIERIGGGFKVVGEAENGIEAWNLAPLYIRGLFIRSEKYTNKLDKIVSILVIKDFGEYTRGISRLNWHISQYSLQSRLSVTPLFSSSRWMYSTSRIFREETCAFSRKSRYCRSTSATSSGSGHVSSFSFALFNTSDTVFREHWNLMQCFAG
ncbi:response regulator [Paenibacillus chitinolyticus]|uniref:hypothetical protein n=1 Tax=Paenibacillus chitinolyticus TaxID=79263 RepID=UPI00295EC9D4|nr:hypothetical protein [Paenibacillus chitinolyticus]